jgi:uncharacterized protein (DUF1778 family)
MCPMAKPQRKPKARPPRPVKDEMIRFRITSEEKAGLDAAAAKVGLDLSSWIRQLALRAAGLLPRAQ